MERGDWQSLICHFLIFQRRAEVENLILDRSKNRTH